MNDYYPIQCSNCKRFIGYCDTDFEDVDEYSVDIRCKYCMDVKPRK